MQRLRDLVPWFPPRDPGFHPPRVTKRLPRYLVITPLPGYHPVTCQIVKLLSRGLLQHETDAGARP